jgi:hypothetical protein
VLEVWFHFNPIWRLGVGNIWCKSLDVHPWRRGKSNRVLETMGQSFVSEPRRDTG